MQHLIIDFNETQYDQKQENINIQSQIQIINKPFQNSMEINNTVEDLELVQGHQINEEMKKLDSDQENALLSNDSEMQQQQDPLDETLTIKYNNALKNIIKSFHNFMTDHKNSEFLSNFVMQKPYKYSLKLVRNFFRNFQYNNSDLVRLIKHQKYSKALEFYLTFDALEWLQYSNVQRMDDHIKLIDQIKSICANKNLEECNKQMNYNTIYNYHFMNNLNIKN